MLCTAIVYSWRSALAPRSAWRPIAAAEFSDRNKYASQGNARAISAEERGHAAVIQQMARAPPRGSVSGADIARTEPWHRGASGNNLRAAVLGANDGLVSNFSSVWPAPVPVVASFLSPVSRVSLPARARWRSENGCQSPTRASWRAHRSRSKPMRSSRRRRPSSTNWADLAGERPSLR